MKILIKLLVFLFWAVSCFSQDYIFKPRRLGVAKDALSNFISEMERDENGFLWLATRNGIHRFDGNMFDDFQGRGDDLKLAKKHYNCISYQGYKVYAGNQRGVSMFNTNTCNYEKFDDALNEGAVVRAIHCSPASWVYWINEQGSLIAREAKGKGSKKILLGGGFFNPKIASQGKELYCLTDSIFFVLNTDDLSIKTRVSIPEVSVTASIVSVDKEKVLFVKGKVLFSFDLRSRQLSNLYNFKEEVTDLEITPFGLFAIENGNSIFYYSLAGTPGKGVKIDMLFNSPVYFSGILYLKDQLLVKSSNGIFIIDINPRYFRTFFQTYDSTGKYFYDPRGISQAGDNIFLFSFFKNHSWNSKTRQFTRIFSSERIGAHSVFTENDTAWIGTEGTGLVKFNTQNLTWKAFKPGPGQGKENLGITSISPYGKDRFLLGAYSGVYQFKRSENYVTLLKLDLPEWKTTQPFVEDVIAINDGDFLIATNRGAYRIGKDLKLKTVFSSKDGNSLSDQCHAILISSEGNVWVGTSNGLFCYSRDGVLLKHLTKSSGLAGDRIASLIFDRLGNIWVGTFSGLSCIEFTTGKVFHFNTDEGLPDNEFNHASACLLRSGEIIMGTTKGFVIFDPQKCLLKPKVNSRVRLSKIEYGTSNGENVIYDPEEIDKGIIHLGREINYGKMYLRYEEEKYLDNVSFDYLIEGVHDNWQTVRSDNCIQLVNLRPGWYKMKVRMLVDESIIENSVQVFDLHAREYFYSTKWFYLLTAGIIFLLIIFYLRLLLARERKFKELRLLLSQNLHDEVGSYLTGISMNLDMIKKKPEGLSNYQQSISELSRKALAALKDGLWSLDRESDNGQHLWDRVKVLAKESFEPLDISYSINAPANLAAIRLEILQKNQLIYVIKECFTNALKYGKGNAVSVNWETTGGRHRVIIKNRKSDEIMRTGGMMGLDNIRFRMEKMGGNMVLDETAQEFSVILMLDFIK